jgi:carbon-monoxide dehydrogenase small subunit
MKKTIEIRVNGKPMSASVEPRLQLADFLREDLLLTGTHLGCEHGVCGACTIQIDGAPARSCIAYAVACDGVDVRTIEGFDDDPVMAELREAFSAEHALQCGYCTPGMLITARDIVLRLPDADEPRIRKELAGNLCRCTGYVGIVRAIQRVIAERRPKGDLLSIRAERSAVQSTNIVRPEPGSVRTKDERPRATEPLSTPVGPEPSTPRPKDERPQSQQTMLRQSFMVDHRRDRVWVFFGHLDEVTLCLPGASLLGTPTDDHVETKIRMKLGPIVAEFQGAADAVRDASTYSGTIRGSARDARSSSTTSGEIRYSLLEEKGGAATRVDVDVAYTLTGPLAQFSRSSIVQDIAKRMTTAFAQNLQVHLAAADSGTSAARTAHARAPELNAGSLFFSVLWERIKRLFGAR